MKIRILFMLWFLLTTSIPFVGQKPGQRHPTQAPTVHIKGRGCLQPGNVRGCMVINDFSAHRKYNVFFVTDKPDMNNEITFEGLGYSHPDHHCNQGQKVQVTEWKPSGRECPQRQAK